LVTISSGEYTASIKLFGAELCSVKHVPTSTEYIWQAELAWPRHAPLLFPFVGRCRNFEYRYNGHSFTIEQHGFARDMQFTLVENLSNKAVFELTENEYTLQRYPFLFRFRITYLLEDNKLTMGFEVMNTGNSVLPVSFGAHPAFQISEPGDVYIQFESDENPQSWLLEGNFISERTKIVSDGKGTIEITKESFLEDALIFKHLKSNWVKLISPKDNRVVKISLTDWPYLGIWAKPGASFVCIEPWQGLADSINFEGEVNKKEGILMVPSFANVSKSFTMEFSNYHLNPKFALGNADRFKAL